MPLRIPHALIPALLLGTLLSAACDPEGGSCPETYLLEGSGSIAEVEVPPPVGSCELPSSCDTVIVAQDDEGLTEIVTPDALACALDALDEGQPGEYRFEWNLLGVPTAGEVVVRVYEGQYVELADDSWVDDEVTKARFAGELDPGFSFQSCAAPPWDLLGSCLQGGILACTAWPSDGELCPG